MSRSTGFSSLRNIAVLVILAAAVLLALWYVRSRKDGPDLTLGGPLFRAHPDSVTGLLLTRGGGQYRLDRREGDQWSLSGAVVDFVDPAAVRTLLSDLASATGGALLPGTEIEDRRYEFNGLQAIRLSVFTQDGSHETLALGTVNPVTGNFYGSGAGRSRCFPVAAALRERIAALPLTIQLQTLLPRIDSGLIESIDLTRNDREHRLRRLGDRWWLLRGPEDGDFRDELLRRYHELYQDRVLTDAEGTWVLASSEAVEDLVHDVSEIVLREIIPPEAAQSRKNLWGLDRIWRRVKINGRGVNPDPTGSSPDQLEVIFGEPLNSQLIPAVRRGIVLLADGVAANTLDTSLEDLVHGVALTSRVVGAIGLVAEREGRLVLKGERDPGPVSGDGRQAWRTVVPHSLPMTEKRRAALAGELVKNLDRIPVLAVLSPVSDPGVLEDGDRVRFTLTHDQADGSVQEVFEVGYLQTERLSAEDRDRIRSGSEGRPLGLWLPGSGQLLQVQTEALVTVRNLELVKE